MKKTLLSALALMMLTACSNAPASSTQESVEPTSVSETVETTKAPVAKTDTFTGPTQDSVTSASIVPSDYVKTVKASGFSDNDSEKALVVVGDPRHNSVTWDLANTTIEYLQEKGMEVELRDLYSMNFNPVLNADTFYYAKDGQGEPSEAIKKEQDLVTQADHLIFVYPNWHDSEIAIVKGYKEQVFAKKFAYQDGANGLEGLLTGKTMYTIMNCGYLGGGRGWIGDGVGIEDEKWDTYMNAYKVFDDDTAAFWGVTNVGRFMNDRTPGNESENYCEEIAELEDALKANLDKVYFSK